MYICVCSAVKETEWKEALRRCGNDPILAAEETGAGHGCGGCLANLTISPLSLSLRTGEEDFPVPA